MQYLDYKPEFFVQEKELAEEKKQRKEEYETLSAKLAEKSRAGKTGTECVSSWAGILQYSHF